MTDSDVSHERPVHVAVAMGDCLIREGLVAILSSMPEARVTAWARTVPEATALVGSQRCDVLLIDLFLPGGGAQTVLKAVGAKTREPGVAFLVLGAPDEVRGIVCALRDGADAYFPLCGTSAELYETVRSLMVGRPVLHPRVLERLAFLLHRDPQPAADDVTTRPEPVPGLSRHQEELLALLSWGLPNKRIADELGISLGAVKTRISRLVRHLDVDSRFEAALLGARIRQASEAWGNRAGPRPSRGIRDGPG